MKMLFALTVATFCFLASSAQKIDLRNATIEVNDKKFKIEKYFLSDFLKEFGEPDEVLDGYKSYLYYYRLGMESRFEEEDKYLRYLHFDFMPLDKSIKRFTGELTIYGKNIAWNTTPEDLEKIKELRFVSGPSEGSILFYEYVFETKDSNFKFTFSHDKKSLMDLDFRY